MHVFRFCKIARPLCLICLLLTLIANSSFFRPSRFQPRTRKRQHLCRSRNKFSPTLDSQTRRTKELGKSTYFVKVSFVHLTLFDISFQHWISALVFDSDLLLRSENESLAISPVKRAPGSALYQDYSVLSDPTSSRYQRAFHLKQRIFNAIKDLQINVRLSMVPPPLPSSRASAPVQRAAGPFRFQNTLSIIGKIISNNKKNQIQHLAVEEEQGGVRENQLARSGVALNTFNKNSTVCQSVSLDYYFKL